MPLPTEYRNLRHSEEDKVLHLWSDVLEGDLEMRARVFRDFADEPRRFARTFVAVAEDGTILSLAAYWLRELRDGNGTPCRTGHLWGVATRPEARRQGLASKLLDLTVSAMQQEGCQWSILFAREEARSLYTQAGWQGIPYHYRSGIVTELDPQSPSPYHVRAWEAHPDEETWVRLARIYADENQRRPLTMVRPQPYWHGNVNWMLGDWIRNHRAVLLVATTKATSDEWCGYLVAHFYDAAYAQENFGSPPWFFISEIGALAQNQEITTALLYAAKERARSQGMGYAQLVLPDEPHIKAALQEIFGDTLQTHAEEGSAMIRSISPTAPSLPLASTDRSFLWSVDQF